MLKGERTTREQAPARSHLQGQRVEGEPIKIHDLALYPDHEIQVQLTSNRVPSAIIL